MTGVGEAMAAINLDDEMTAEERAERAAREAAEIAAIARDWNRFNKEELVRPRRGGRSRSECRQQGRKACRKVE